MSANITSPKPSSVPIVRGSKFSPSLEKTGQAHRSTFHLSNLFHTLTKFSRNIRTTNSFIRSTSSNSADAQIKLTRRSFNKSDPAATSILRPSSCFVLLSPARQEKDSCLFFQKPVQNNASPKVNGTSSFSKLKRVSSFLLPLKRKQSLSLNHSHHDRSFKAKETTKRRSRLLTSSTFRAKIPTPPIASIRSGAFGYDVRRAPGTLFERRYIPFDLINIDLLSQFRLNHSMYNNYQLVLPDASTWWFIQLFKPSYGIVIEEQSLVFFQPKLSDHMHRERSTNEKFIYLPFHSIKAEETQMPAMGYDACDPRTIRVPLTRISKNASHEYHISAKLTVQSTAGHTTTFMHDNHPLFENGKSTSVTVRCSLKRNASLISEALRHYQRLENETNRERLVEKSSRKSEKQHRRPYQIKECKIRPIIVQQAVTHKIKPSSHLFDPIHLRRKQCSSTLIDEDLPMVSARPFHCLPASSSSSSGFRSNSRSSSVQTSSLVGCIGQAELSSYAHTVPIESTKLVYHAGDEMMLSSKSAGADNSKRANVIKEIYKTENDYLGHLRNLVDGYMKKMRQRTDLFTEKQIELVMGNIEDIYHFQQSFFQLLKLSINEQNLCESLIGKCFLLYKEEFKKYSDYCINHPLSCLELTKLENNLAYQNFFETCRLQANMIELKLDGFLLSPIQRICQYPLQLNELLKYTNAEHKDYENIQQALHTMRDVASFINERKRRMEFVEVIHKWQSTVEHWQGKNLIETSTQGLGRADAYLYQNGKKEQVTLFLFDHVLIICKKDRRNSLIYFGRADLDHSEFEDLLDGKVSRLDEENLVHLLFAWRLYDQLQNKTYLFAHRSPVDKVQMIDALEYERAYVEENLTKGLEIPLYTRLATLKTQQYLADQPAPMSRSTTATSFPFITKPNRSISAILRTSNTQCNNQSIVSSTTTAMDHPPVSRRRFVPSRKSSLPRFVRSSSRDSSIDDSLRSVKSRFRFWS